MTSSRETAMGDIITVRPRHPRYCQLCFGVIESDVPGRVCEACDTDDLSELPFDEPTSQGKRYRPDLVEIFSRHT